MACETPIRIKNQYNGKWMHVNCRHCDMCRISDANKKGAELSVYLKRFKYLYFVTLTYDDDHVPYIIENCPHVLRGQNEIEIIGDIEEDLSVPYDFTKYFVMPSHSIAGAVGVLWYDDVQRFLKRLRKYINKHYGRKQLKFFSVAEYGSRYQRPHFHIVFGFDDFSYEQFKDSVLQNWKMCDWTKLFNDKGEFQGVKRCDKGTAYYCASYVNCIANRDGISQHKQFRQKTRRSKSLDFGTDFTLYETFKEDVIRIADNDFRRYDLPPFYYFNTEQVNNISVCLFQPRYLASLFHKFKSWSQMAFVDRISRAYNIVEYCETCERYGISKGYDSINYRSDDLSFYRAYKRFLKEFACDRVCSGFSSLKDYFRVGNIVNFSLSDYIVLMDKVLTYYDSQLLRLQMEKSKDLDWCDYVLEQIDTLVEEPDDRWRRWHLKKLMHRGPDGERKDTKIKYWKDSIFQGIDLGCPPSIRQVFDVKKKKYKKRLLPKHFNDLSNFLNPSAYGKKLSSRC